MAVEIPVYIDIESGIKSAINRLPGEMKDLQAVVSANTLKFHFDIGDGERASLEKMLVGRDMSMDQLRAGLRSIKQEFTDLSRQVAHNQKLDPGDRQIKNLAKAYMLLEQRITGVSNKAAGQGLIVEHAINKVQAKLSGLITQLNTQQPGSDAFNRINYQIKVQEDRLRKLNLQYEQYGVLSKRAGNTVAASMEKANNAASRHNRLLQSISSLAASYLSIWQLGRFIHNIRETTSQFEMQRVALGGIIQDTEKASSLFRQIKAEALRSPFEIKDLVSYTKQLSAYRIETDKLFDVTKRLADVSAGLGVDMGRIILAYGQVRAASVLRGQELRQFTEAGIPLVEELAKKFTLLNGRMVSTAEVFELISKRAVPFSMIEEIFNDMTEAGGTFYKMQERQAETLAGQWANLKDALSIMYDEIGNTQSVHRAMEDLIGGAKTLMNNWRQIATIIGVVGQGFIALKIASLFMPRLAYNTELAEKATNALARASALEAKQQGRANIIRAISIKSLRDYATVTKYAAAAQTAFGRGFLRLGAFLAGGGWIAIATTAITVLAGWLISAQKEANRLKNELTKIGAEGALSLNRSVSNFNRLAEAAVNAADGSDEQNKALAELQRTYGDIIPVEELQVKKLRELHGSYESLTEAIREKVNMQIREQKISAIQDSYSSKMTRQNKKSQRLLQQYGLDKDQVRAVLDEVQSAVDKGLIDINSNVAVQSRVFANIIKKMTGIVVDFGNGFRDYTGQWHKVDDIQNKAFKSLQSVAGIYLNLHEQTEAVENDMDSLIGTMGVYANSWKKLEDDLKGVTASEEIFGRKGTFAYNEEVLRKRVQKMADAITEAFSETGIDISQAFRVPDRIDFKFLAEAAKQGAASGFWGLDSLISKVQKKYEDLIPSDPFVTVIKTKFQEIAQGVGLSMDDVQGFLKKSDEDIRKYTKGIKESLQGAVDKLAEMHQQNEAAEKYSVVPRVSDEDLNKQDALVKFFQELVKYLDAYAKHNKGGRDNRLSLLRSEISELTNAYKKFEELKKYKTEDAAIIDINTLFPQLKGDIPSLDYVVSELEKKLEQVKKDLARSPKSKTLLDMKRTLETEISNLKFDDLKEQITRKLKEAKDSIKRSEVARNFYEDILNLTGDENVASSLQVSIYGDVSKDFKERMQEQLNGALESLKIARNGEVTDDIKDAFANMDFKAILQIADLPKEVEEAVREAYESMQKHNADWVLDIMKTYQKTRTYEERITDIQKREAKNRERIAANTNFSSEQKATYTEASRKKEAEDIAKVQLEALKDTYTWTKAFENLEGVSTRTLEDLVDLIDEYITKYAKDLEPQQLKELTRSREQARAQLMARNSWRALADSMTKYITAVNTRRRLEKSGAKDSEDYVKGLDAEKKAIMELESSMATIKQEFDSAASSAKELVQVFASTSDSEHFSEQMDNAAKALSGISSATVGIARLSAGDISPQSILQTVNGLADIVTGVANFAAAAQMKKWTEEMTRQEKLVSQLEYSYDHLSHAMDRAFGSDYLYNYNEQMDILIAKQAAYNKQLAIQEAVSKEASRKADRDAAIEAIEEIKKSLDEVDTAMMDLRESVTEKFLGSDLTSAAEEFADSWFDAYREFGSTTDAIQEKMEDMIKNLIIKSTLAGAAEKILKPFFDKVEELSAANDLSPANIQSLSVMLQGKMGQIDESLTSWMQVFRSMGMNMRSQVGNFSGIARNIAGASEESILGLAAGINTQNYYMSYVPTISVDVQRIIELMGGSTEAAPAVATTATAEEGPVMPSIQEMVYDHLPNIDRNMSELLRLVSNVVKPNGTSASYYVATKM